LETVIEQYGLPDSTDIQFYLRGINDTYKLYVPGGLNLALKVSRHGWRRRDQLNYESRLLDHISSNGVSVAAPVKSVDGSYLFECEAPEGGRFLSVTHWIEGSNQRNNPSLSGSSKLGEHLAKIHLCGQSLPGSTDQQLEYYSDTKSYGSDLSDILSLLNVDHGFLSGLMEYVSRYKDVISKDLPKGPCHGDVHGGNAIDNPDGRVSLIDFDVCGFGYLSFDVASYLWSVALFDWSDNHNQAFLEGYESVRALSDTERQVFPFFDLLRDLWHLVTWARNADCLGTHWFHPTHIGRRMDMLREKADRLSWLDR